MSDKSTRELANELGAYIGQPELKPIRPVQVRVDFGCLERIARQIKHDRERGLLPEEKP